MQILETMFKAIYKHSKTQTTDRFKPLKIREMSTAKARSLKDGLIFPPNDDAKIKRVWPKDEKDSTFGRVKLPNVGVKEKRNVFWGRKWNSFDILVASGLAVLHLLCVLAPSTFKWDAFGVAVALYFITGLLGITLSFHRNLSHRSFKLPKWLEYFFAYCGTLALQVPLSLSLMDPKGAQAPTKRFF